MDFTLADDVASFVARTATFVRERIVPLEGDRANFDEHENLRIEVLERVRRDVKSAGLWAPNVAREWGGQGMSLSDSAACYEAMNESIFGPVCFNCAAPDDGNMRVLAQIATPEQQERWLRPIADGTVRSAFVMTEPHPGSGSDPTMMRTRARRVGDRWVIEGRKWFITGAGVARHFILMARTSDDARKGLTAFLFDSG